MAHRAFVDTSGWYALIDKRDASHSAFAAEVTRLIQTGGRLVTTDYVIDESCTLAKARSGPAAAARLLEIIDKTAALDLVWVAPERFAKAKAFFLKHHDQAFSFTDCTSFVVMREERIDEAITIDAHFRVAGFKTLPR